MLSKDDRPIKKKNTTELEDYSPFESDLSIKMEYHYENIN